MFMGSRRCSEPGEDSGDTAAAASPASAKRPLVSSSGERRPRPSGLLRPPLPSLDVEFAQQVVHEAGRRVERLALLGRGGADAVVVVAGDGVGQLGEAALVSVEGVVVVGLAAAAQAAVVAAELESVQRDAEGAEGGDTEGSRASVGVPGGGSAGLVLARVAAYLWQSVSPMLM
ncbi:hypothetical protein EYF80_039758 [Liparis tanakae]|uniref:Uncharacterized protein n=1 Tax=Liparis tanakae TaxID=230148 RepID=A0A4Z2G901_9TELE|nr:hypothetical protein EYF80_039758 [Liparis tanakae]